MALQPSIGNVPTGAVQVDKRGALSYQYQQIQDWPNFRDVWPFKVGVPVLAGIAGFSALSINRHFRLKVQLRNQGRLPSQVTTGVGSLIFAMAPHIAWVMQDIFLNITPCPLCLETRAVFIQLTGAVIYPCIASPLANFFMAARVGTYRLPHFGQGKEIFNLWFKFMKPLRQKLIVLIAVNAFAAGFITYQEAMSIQTVRTKLMKFAKEMREEERRKKIEKSKQ